MPIKMKPTSQIKARLGIQPNGRVQKFFTNECVKAMDKYIPMREGNLRLIKDERSDSVTYESLYAKYQYYGMREDGSRPVRNYTTPGTGPYWDKRMVSVDMPDIVKRIQDKFGGK